MYETQYCLWNLTQPNEFINRITQNHDGQKSQVGIKPGVAHEIDQKVEERRDKQDSPADHQIQILVVVAQCQLGHAQRLEGALPLKRVEDRVLFPVQLVDKFGTAGVIPGHLAHRYAPHEHLAPEGYAIAHRVQVRLDAVRVMDSDRKVVDCVH